MPSGLWFRANTHHLSYRHQVYSRLRLFATSRTEQLPAGGHRSLRQGRPHGGIDRERILELPSSSQWLSQWIEKSDKQYIFHLIFSIFTYILHLLGLSCWFCDGYMGVGNIHLPTPAYTRLHLEKIIPKHLFLCPTKARKRGQCVDIDSVSPAETVCSTRETVCINAWNKKFQHFPSLVNTLLFNRLSLSLGLFSRGIALKGVGMKAKM